MNDICGKSVSWWDGEYEGTCELPEGHKGPHYDGISCFNDDSEEVELKQGPVKPIVVTLSYQKVGKTYFKQSNVLNTDNLVVTFNPEPGVNILAEYQS